MTTSTTPLVDQLLRNVTLIQKSHAMHNGYYPETTVVLAGRDLFREVRTGRSDWMQWGYDPSTGELKGAFLRGPVFVAEHPGVIPAMHYTVVVGQSRNETAEPPPGTEL